MCRCAIAIAIVLGTIVSVRAQVSPLIGEDVGIDSVFSIRPLMTPMMAEGFSWATSAADDTMWCAGPTLLVGPHGATIQFFPPPIGEYITSLAAIRGRHDVPGVFVTTTGGAWIVGTRRDDGNAGTGRFGSLFQRRVATCDATDPLSDVVPLESPKFAAVFLSKSGRLFPLDRSLLDGSRVMETTERVEPTSRPSQISPTHPAFLVATTERGSFIAQPGRRALQLLEESGAVVEIPLGVDTSSTGLTDVIHDARRQCLFVSTENSVIRVDMEAPFSTETFDHRGAIALGFVANRLIAVSAVAIAESDELVRCEATLTAATAGCMLPWRGRTGPSSLRAARQIESDVIWGEDLQRNLWEWTLDGWKKIADSETLRIKFDTLCRDAGGRRLFVSDGGHAAQAVCAAFERDEDRWTTQAIEGTSVFPDPSREGFWVVDESALQRPTFATPHGSVTVAGPPNNWTAPPRRSNFRNATRLSSGRHLVAESAGCLVLHYGGGFAVLRGGEVAYVADDPTQLRSLVPAGNSTDSAAFLAIEATETAWCLVAIAVELDSGRVALRRSRWLERDRAQLPDEPTLMTDARGTVWFAEKVAGSWKARQLMAGSISREIAIGPSDRFPMLLEEAPSDSPFGNNVVATESAVLRIAERGEPKYRREAVNDDDKIVGFAPVWTRSEFDLKQWTILTRPRSAGSTHSRSRTVGASSSDLVEIDPPPAISESVLLDVRPESVACAARAVWSDASTASTWIEWYDATAGAVRKVPDIRSAIASAVISAPGALAGTIEFSDEMIAVVDGSRIAIQRLPRAESWTDEIIVTERVTRVFDSEGKTPRVGNLEAIRDGEILRSRLPTTARRVEVRLNFDGADFWTGRLPVKATVDGQDITIDKRSEIRVEVQPNRARSLKLASTTRCGLPGSEFLPMSFDVEPAPTEPAHPRSPWIWAVLALIALIGILGYVRLRRRRQRLELRPPMSPSALSEGIHIFISYKRDDEAWVHEFAAALDRAGGTTWYDVRDIAEGDNWDVAIDNAIKHCRVFLVVISPASVASEEVRNEVARAIQLKKPILPVKHREAEMLRRLLTKEWIDMVGHPPNHPQSIDRVLRFLKSVATVPSEASSAESQKPDVP